MGAPQRSEAPSRARTYRLVALVAVIAAVFGVYAFVTTAKPSLREFAFFWVLYGLTLLDRVEVPVERLTLVRESKPRGVGLSPGFVVLLTAAFATSPATVFTVAAVPPIAVLLDREQRQVSRLIFNVSQEAVYASAAAMLFSTVRAVSPDSALLAFAAAALGGVVALALNALLVAAVVAADRGISLRELLRRMSWTLPHSFAFGLIALMIATLYADHGEIAAVFFFLPLAALRIARRAKLQLEHVRGQTVLEFVRTVEAKDPYTYQHSERVAAIVVELHRELGATAEELERRWTAALLHDVGKVAVPGSLLRKPGALTRDEFAVIELHPVIGASAVEQIDLFRDLAPEILSHHERLDGGGYPQGLSGEAIPWAARVLAVADAYEALTSTRTYREARRSDEALEVLRRSAGSHHEPRVVEALAEVLARNVEFIRPGAIEVSRAAKVESV